MTKSMVHASTIKVIRYSCGEKNREVLHFWRCGLLNKFAVVVKLFRHAFLHTSLRPAATNTDVAAKLDGINQRRIFNELCRPCLTDESDFLATVKSARIIRRGIFGPVQLCCLTLVLLMSLITRRQRHLFLYFILIHRYSGEWLTRYGKRLEQLILLNDQFHINAALALSCWEQGVRVIVIQHGVVFRQLAYFPSNSDEFCAWGASVRGHFSARRESSCLRIVGRYPADSQLCAREFVSIDSKTLSVAVAVGYRWREVIEVLRQWQPVNVSSNWDAVDTWVKFHPSTRFKPVLEVLLKVFFSRLKIERNQLEPQIGRFDGLITINSTLALDFLLHGKFIVSCGGDSAVGFMRGTSLQVKQVVQGPSVVNDFLYHSESCRKNILRRS